MFTKIGYWSIASRAINPLGSDGTRSLGVYYFQTVRRSKGLLVKKGYTKAWRKELDSDIWLMPPVYHRVWYWLRQKVQHTDFLFPTKNGFGIWVLPGQRLTSLQDIADGVKWFDNRREIVPDRRTVKRVLDWLEFHQCLALTCHTSGTLITVINWDTYNHTENELSTDDVQPHVPPHVHKKRIKKNVKEENIYSDLFVTLWGQYPNKVERPTAERHFKKTVKTETDAEDIQAALNNYLSHLRRETWKKPKNGSTWFNNWRDWIPTTQPDIPKVKTLDDLAWEKELAAREEAMSRSMEITDGL